MTDMDSDHKEEAPCEDCKAFEERIEDLEIDLDKANTRIGELEDERDYLDEKKGLFRECVDDIREKCVDTLDGN